MRQGPEVFTTRIPFWDEAKRSIWVFQHKTIAPTGAGQATGNRTAVVHFHAGSVPGRQG